jgi:hypothetical protein
MVDMRGYERKNGQLRRGRKGIVTKDEYQRGSAFCQEALVNKACQKCQDNEIGKLPGNKDWHGQVKEY